MDSFSLGFLLDNRRKYGTVEIKQESLDKLRREIKSLKQQIAYKDQVLHRKNIELDALHYVWCTGGCKTGVHRYDDGEITEEIVLAAERNTKRLRGWWDTHCRRLKNG